jgi:hypothetical protein
MTNLYVISITDASNVARSFGIVADTRAAAETKACELAGVPDGTEPQTSQTLHRVDAVVE